MTSGWSTLRPARIAAFNFVGAFALTNFYLDAVATNPARVKDALPGQHPAINTTAGKTHPVNRWKYSESFIEKQTQSDFSAARRSVVQDAELLIQENESTAVFVIFLLCLAGGASALIGFGSAFIFDGQAGTRRYEQIKDIVNH
jgi:hypothetical protein